MKRQHRVVRAIAMLAVTQAILGVLRSMEWIRLGGDLAGQGLLLIPLVGMVAIARGWIIGIVALIYVLFAVGIVLGKRWSWQLGLVAVIINSLVVVSSLSAGESFGRSLIWLIVPIALIAYLFSSEGSRILMGQSPE